MATLDELYQSALSFNNNGVAQMDQADYQGAGKYFCQALSFLKHFVTKQHNDASHQLGYDDPHVMTLRAKGHEFRNYQASLNPIALRVKQPFTGDCNMTTAMTFCPTRRQFIPDPSPSIINDLCQQSDWVQPIRLTVPENINKVWIESHTSDVETVVVLVNMALNYAAVMKSNPTTIPNIIGTKLRMLELAQELVTEIMTFMAEDHIPSEEQIGLYQLEAIVTSTLVRAHHCRGIHTMDPRVDSGHHLLRRLQQINIVINQYHTQLRNKNKNIVNNFFILSQNNSCAE